MDVVTEYEGLFFPWVYPWAVEFAERHNIPERVVMLAHAFTYLMVMTLLIFLHNGVKAAYRAYKRRNLRAIPVGNNHVQQDDYPRPIVCTGDDLFGRPEDFNHPLPEGMIGPCGIEQLRGRPARQRSPEDDYMVGPCGIERPGGGLTYVGSRGIEQLQGRPAQRRYRSPEELQNDRSMAYSSQQSDLVGEARYNARMVCGFEDIQRRGLEQRRDYTEDERTLARQDMRSLWRNQEKEFNPMPNMFT
ncbi:hypothetical protein F4821DRAFT_279851 [Hypoxylon rubiginosum]|uniref:Uncharacterized protein n=1 Tax=Hypoxylon rubiginosum TaxID=110542 RepID=A0ACC0CWE9_9PEZI|nr:hypothetical protein F4821DRAFT_279851 [Hypoxylon rubiginosum]